MNIGMLHIVPNYEFMVFATQGNMGLNFQGPKGDKVGEWFRMWKHGVSNTNEYADQSSSFVCFLLTSG